MDQQESPPSPTERPPEEAGDGARAERARSPAERRASHDNLGDRDHDEDNGEDAGEKGTCWSPRTMAAMRFSAGNGDDGDDGRGNASGTRERQRRGEDRSAPPPDDDGNWVATLAERWDRKFEELVKFRAVAGNCNASRSSSQTREATALGNWVHRQRVNYKSNGGALAGNRVARLDRLGFAWEVYQKQKLGRGCNCNTVRFNGQWRSKREEASPAPDCGTDDSGSSVSSESAREGDDGGTGGRRRRGEEEAAAADRGNQGGGRGERASTTTILPKASPLNDPMDPPGPSNMVVHAREGDGNFARDHGGTRPDNEADESTSEAVGEGDDAERNAGDDPPPLKQLRTDHPRKRPRCAHEGCPNISKLGGACIRHRAPRQAKQICRHEGCDTQARGAGVCRRHGAPRRQRTCRHPGCTSIIQKGGVCQRHGSNRGVRIPVKRAHEQTPERDGRAADEAPRSDGPAGTRTSAVEEGCEASAPSSPASEEGGCDGAEGPVTDEAPLREEVRRLREEMRQLREEVRRLKGTPERPGSGRWDGARPAVFRLHDEVDARLAAAARGENAGAQGFYRHAMAWLVRTIDEKGFAPAAFDAAPLQESMEIFEDVCGRLAAARATGRGTSAHVYAVELRFVVEEFKASFSFPLVKPSRPVEHEREADR